MRLRAWGGVSRNKGIGRDVVAPAGSDRRGHRQEGVADAKARDGVHRDHGGQAGRRRRPRRGRDRSWRSWAIRRSGWPVPRSQASTRSATWWAPRSVTIASGIISVDRFDRAALAAAYAEIEASHPGRFLVGLGGPHGPTPRHSLADYLDGLDTVPPIVPATRRILAALGPRMLRLARDRAAGAYPLAVTPDYTAHARSLVGDDAALVVGQFVIIESDPGRGEKPRTADARPHDRHRRPLRGNLRRMGFAGHEITQLSDRLVDALVAWGDVEAVAVRISEHLRAGADHVAVERDERRPTGLPPGQAVAPTRRRLCPLAPPHFATRS